MFSYLAPATWGMLFDGGAGAGVVVVRGQGLWLAPCSHLFLHEAAFLCGEGAGGGLASAAFGAVTAFSQELQTRSSRGMVP